MSIGLGSINLTPYYHLLIVGVFHLILALPAFCIHVRLNRSDDHPDGKITGLLAKALAVSALTQPYLLPYVTPISQKTYITALLLIGSAIVIGVAFVAATVLLWYVSYKLVEQLYRELTGYWELRKTTDETSSPPTPSEK